MTEILRAIAGLLLWSLAFATIYGLQGLGCAYGWAEIPIAGISLMRAMLVGGWLVFLGLHGALILALSDSALGARDPFFRRLSLTIAITGLVASLWSLFPVAVISICGGG